MSEVSACLDVVHGLSRRLTTDGRHVRLRAFNYSVFLLGNLAQRAKRSRGFHRTFQRLDPVGS
jgi:hypothetical protein